jgi:hypothetical protein
MSTAEKPRKVLQLMARGMSNAEIAAHMVVIETTSRPTSPGPRQAHAARPGERAVVLAYESGLIQPGGS